MALIIGSVLFSVLLLLLMLNETNDYADWAALDFVLLAILLVFMWATTNTYNVRIVVDRTVAGVRYQEREYTSRIALRRFLDRGLNHNRYFLVAPNGTRIETTEYALMRMTSPVTGKDAIVGGGA